MSKVVTPPDVVNEDCVLLIVNAVPNDIDLVAKWLRFSEKNYTIHLYHDGMDSVSWLKEVANTAQIILVNRNSTQDNSIKAMYDSIAKIKWIGEEQEFATATDYLVKNG